MHAEDSSARGSAARPADVAGTAERRLLVVDDDPDVREIAVTALELVGGWTVTSAGSGRAAVDLARREKPDAILLDVMMPDLDGPATIRQLREDPATADIPVVLLTAKTRVDDRATWQAMGLAGVIGKPFDPMTLPDHVARLLGWAR